MSGRDFNFQTLSARMKRPHPDERQAAITRTLNSLPPDRINAALNWITDQLAVDTGDLDNILAECRDRYQIRA